MKVKSQVGRIAEVTWEDAWSNDSRYFTYDSIKEEPPMIIRSVGKIIRDDASGITLAVDDFGDGEFRHIKHRPAAMVRKVEILK